QVAGAAAGKPDVMAGVTEGAAAQEVDLRLIVARNVELILHVHREGEWANLLDRAVEDQTRIRKSILFEAAIEVRAADIMAKIAANTRGAGRRKRAGRWLTTDRGREDLLTRGIHHVVIAERPEQVGTKCGAGPGEFGDLAERRVLASTL